MAINPVDPEQEEELQRKQELIEKSKARVAKWPNTLTAMRQKKEEEKMKRLYDEEVSVSFCSMFNLLSVDGKKTC